MVATASTEHSYWASGERVLSMANVGGDDSGVHIRPSQLDRTSSVG